MKVLTTFYRRVILVVHLLDDTIPVLRSRLPVVITILTETNINAYHRFRPEQSLQEIQARLARGDRCFACWYENRIIDAGWVATGRVHIPYLRRDLILDPRDIYNYDSYTLPAYRGRGLYMARNAYIARYNWQEGFSRSVAVVAVENKALLAILLKSGLKPIGLYSCMRFGPWQRGWQQPWGEEALPLLVSLK
jgi:RimJ/RimL family protein N-acetyltransferase